MIAPVCYTYRQMNFSNCNLDSTLLQGLEEAGYIECTPVQEQVFSAGMDGSDLYVQLKQVREKQMRIWFH